MSANKFTTTVLLPKPQQEREQNKLSELTKTLFRKNTNLPSMQQAGSSPESSPIKFARAAQAMLLRVPKEEVKTKNTDQGAQKESSPLKVSQQKLPAHSKTQNYQKRDSHE